VENNIKNADVNFSHSTKVHTALFVFLKLREVWTFYKSFGGIILMRSTNLALSVQQQLKTKKKKQTNRQVSPKNISNEHIQTRSKKSVIKSNHKSISLSCRRFLLL